jgi:hypothetical protein
MVDLPPTAPISNIDVLSSKSTIVDSSVVDKEAAGEAEIESEVQRKKAPIAAETDGGASEDPGNEVLANFFQSLLAKKPGAE